MGFDEFLVFIGSLIGTVLFLIKWYISPFSVWPPERGRLARWVHGLLPAVSLLIIVYTLATLAASDVVEMYVFFYILLGISWVYFTTFCIKWFWDISWLHDVFDLNNYAALCAVAGAVIGSTLIYAGANVGEGPGWWCVIFAGGLGFAVWLLLPFILHKITGLLEHITVDRDLASGLRLCFFLIASGLILARASAGDWTSASATVVEFLDGWPVLILFALALAVELAFRRTLQSAGNKTGIIAASVLIGLLYILIAIAALYLLSPLPQNPIYKVAPGAW